MEIKIKVNHIDGVSKSNTGDIYLNIFTDVGRMIIPFNNFLKFTQVEELYNVGGFIKNIARHFRGKYLSDLTKEEKYILNNIPEKLKEEYEIWKMAGIITEFLGDRFKDYYEKYYIVCKEKSISAIEDNFIQQVQLYKKIKEKMQNSKLFSVKKSYKNYIEKFLEYFDDSVKLAAEVEE